MAVKLSQPLRDIGMIVYRKKVELKLELLLFMKKTLLSLQTQRREKEISSFERIKEMETSKAGQSLMCQRSSTTISISWDTMLEIVSARKER